AALPFLWLRLTVPATRRAKPLTSSTDKIRICAFYPYEKMPFDPRFDPLSFWRLSTARIFEIIKVGSHTVPINPRRANPEPIERSADSLRPRLQIQSAAFAVQAHRDLTPAIPCRRIV